MVTLEEIALKKSEFWNITPPHTSYVGNKYLLTLLKKGAL